VCVGGRAGAGAGVEAEGEAMHKSTEGWCAWKDASMAFERAGL
jgi:hypothetical protein